METAQQHYQDYKKLVIKKMQLIKLKLLAYLLT